MLYGSLVCLRSPLLCQDRCYLISCMLHSHAWVFPSTYFIYPNNIWFPFYGNEIGYFGKILKRFWAEPKDCLWKLPAPQMYGCGVKRAVFGACVPYMEHGRDKQLQSQEKASMILSFTWGRPNQFLCLQGVAFPTPLLCWPLMQPPCEHPRLCFCYGFIYPLFSPMTLLPSFRLGWRQVFSCVHGEA